MVIIVSFVGRDLIINNDHISQMEQRLRAAIEKGLNSETHPYASVKCFPTYVRDLPCGTEMGKFLALDLGGTNFRVVLIDIGPDSKFEMDSEIYAISKEIMEGSGEGLMDHIAECLAKFAKDRGIDQEVLPLGFTFSFPCRQKGLAVGELISWTKGFKCSGVEGEAGDVPDGDPVEDGLARDEVMDLRCLFAGYFYPKALMSCSVWVCSYSSIQHSEIL